MKLNLNFTEEQIELPVNYDNMNQRLRRVVREQYVKEQNNLCYHCKLPLDEDSKYRYTTLKLSLFPPNFFKHPVHLHHDHDNGMTIGAVHCHCNAHLWQYHGK